MKSILCFGDSNTWGYNPEAAGMPLCRFAWQQRWTGLLQQQLGEDYQIIEEGLSGRTTVFNDPSAPGRNGLAWLLPCLHTHQPLDLVLIMLGTNDTKSVYGAPAREIATGMERLIQTARNPFHFDCRQPPEVLVVSPIFVGEDIGQSWLWEVFDHSSVEKSKRLPALYKEIAGAYSCHYLSAAELAGPMPGEGIHLDTAGHRALADGFARCITSILG